MITPKTQTAIAVLKCIYARDYGTCIKQCTLTEGQMRVLLTQLTNAGLIILKEKEHPLEIQSYIPAKEPWKYPCWIFSKPRRTSELQQPHYRAVLCTIRKSRTKTRNSKPDNQDIPEGDYTDRFITGTKKLRSRKYIPMLMLLALLSCAGKAGAQTVAMKSDLLTGACSPRPISVWN